MGPLGPQAPPPLPPPQPEARRHRAARLPARHSGQSPEPLPRRRRRGLAVTDGLFQDDPDGHLRFFEADPLTLADVERLTATVRKRVLRHFRRHGLIDPHATDDMLTWHGHGSFSIDASVRIEGRDRLGLEDLLRYCARPPFSQERLETEGGDGPDQVLYHFPQPTPEGTTVLRLSPWSSSNASHSSSFRPTSTATAITASSRPIPPSSLAPPHRPPGTHLATRHPEEPPRDAARLGRQTPRPALRQRPRP
ncbi:MAG: transposase [Gemmatimonadetes bacterium]|nr:transposase [Gemmatimonadota bacterium]